MDERGIINTRNIPYADKNKFGRLHVIMNDHLMSEFATMLSAGTTAIVLRMIEDGFRPNLELLAEGAVQVLREISADTSLKRKYHVGRRRRFTAVEMQRFYLEESFKRFPKIGEQLCDSDFEEIREDWVATLDALSSGDNSIDELVGRLDWVTKRYLARETIRKTGSKWNEVAPKIDRHYHRIYPEGIYYIWMRSSNDRRIQRKCADEDIEFAVGNPPQGTRAAQRVELITEKRNIVHAHRWDYVQYTDEDGRVHNLAAQDPRGDFKEHPSLTKALLSLGYSIEDINSDTFHIPLWNT